MGVAVATMLPAGQERAAVEASMGAGRAPESQFDSGVYPDRKP